MKPEHFVILNFIILLGFVGIFLWGRRDSKSASKLTLNSKSDEAIQKAHDLSLNQRLNQNFGASGLNNKKNSKSTHAGQETLGEFQSQNIKDINPMFIYNGHSWDAYEVLGITPGSSIEEVRFAFEQALQKSNPSSHEFFKTALVSILNEIKSRAH